MAKKKRAVSSEPTRSYRRRSRADSPAFRAALDQTSANMVARQESRSRQPRFAGEQSASIFGTAMRWVREIEESPAYKADSRELDAWLTRFWPKEPYLAGTVSTMVSIDKNRRWSLVGGRNQVMRFQRVLRDANDGTGWRMYASQQSLSYWTTNMGFVTELGRDGEDGPLRAIYHVDPTRFQLTGNPEYPGKYWPTGQSPQEWRYSDFMRGGSLPSVDERFHTLGMCPVYRVLELARLMVAIYRYDNEKLGARAPQGLLILQNISEGQWEDAMSARATKLDGMERRYFGSVAVLASAGVDQADAKLLALSSLPDGFDQKTFVDLLMYGYALVFGIDPAEIWPVGGGSLGQRASEAKVQEQKATTKGIQSWTRDYTDALQQPGRLPSSLTFEFDERNESGDLVQAEVQETIVDLSTRLYEAGLAQGVPLLTREEVRSLLAENGIIPREWTDFDENIEATDTDSAVTRILRERLMDEQGERITRAAELFPHEPIVRYTWPSNRFIRIWDNGRDVLKRSLWHVALPVQRATLYDEAEVEITDEDVDTAVAQARRRVGDEYADMLENTPIDDEELAVLLAQ